MEEYHISSAVRLTDSQLMQAWKKGQGREGRREQEVKAGNQAGGQISYNEAVRMAVLLY